MIFPQRKKGKTLKSEILAWKIRRHAVEITHRTGASHIGSVLSCADILAVLYTQILHFRPEDPQWPDRDRFLLSKGHAALGLYSALAEMGFFPAAELETFYGNGSLLQGHVSHRVPGVEFSTGSLGHGLGAAVGMALGAKMDGKFWRTYAVLGDGECNEGSLWEAVQAAAFFHLDNLTVIVDHNHLQSLDSCENTMLTGTLAEKWSAFGWDVTEVDGHDHEALRRVLYAPCAGIPRAVIAHTVKGKGIPFMENEVLWHYRYPHGGKEYREALGALAAIRPENARDPYREAL
jgi:transketolase